MEIFIILVRERERERERENRGMVCNEPEPVDEHVGASDVYCQKSTLSKVNSQSVNTYKWLK